MGAFGGGEEGEEFGFDDAGVVAGLDGEDALDDDLLVEHFFFGADGEFVGEGAADDVGPDGSVEGAEECDLESVGDGSGLVAPPTAAFLTAAATAAGHIFEHADLADEGGGEAEGGAVLAHEFEHFAAMVVAFFDGGELDVHDLGDDGGIGAVDGELEAFFEEGIVGGFDGIFEGEHAIAAGDFGELDDLLDEMLGVDIFVEDAFFDVGGDALGGMPGHGHDAQTDGAAHDEHETFSGVEDAEFAFGAVVHGEDDAGHGDEETDDGGDVHGCLDAAWQEDLRLSARGLSVRSWGELIGVSEKRVAESSYRREACAGGPVLSVRRRGGCEGSDDCFRGCYCGVWRIAMTFALSEETQRLLEERLRAGPYRSADELFRAALEALEALEGGALDDATLDALDRAENQIERGEVEEWGTVRAKVLGKFLGK